MLYIFAEGSHMINNIKRIAAGVEALAIFSSTILFPYQFH
jgi:hypothetical protein